MGEGFLFYRVDGEARRAAIGIEADARIAVLAYIAKSSLVFSEGTVARANEAAYPPVAHGLRIA